MSTGDGYVILILLNRLILPTDRSQVLAESLLHIGVTSVSDGPFLTYNNTYRPRDVQNAVDQIEAVIDEQGPFDGVLGFSQGGSLALTLLLQHQLSGLMTVPPPFRFAILCSPVIAFSSDESFNENVLNSLTPEDFDILNDYPHCEFHKLATEKRLFCETLAQTFESARKGGFIAGETGGGTFASDTDHAEIPRVMHPDLMPINTRLRFPGVVVTGKTDHPMMVKLSKAMARHFDDGFVTSIEHPGGHDIPRDSINAQALAKAISWANDKSLREPVV